MERRGPGLPVDCPACGAPAESGLVTHWPAGGELHCRRCLLTLVAPGVIGHRVHDVPPEPVRMGLAWDAPDDAAPVSSRRPAERRWVLRLVPAGEDPGPSAVRPDPLAALGRDRSISSSTIRLNRRGGGVR